MRLRSISLCFIALCLLPALTSRAQRSTNEDAVYPFRPAEFDASPRIARLRQDVRNGIAGAVEVFWTEMETKGTPLVEPIPGDGDHSRVTFLWRGSSEARNVVITDGVSIGVGGADPMNSQMTRLTDTDVWFRTYDIRNDGRFTYALSENDPMTSFLDPNRRSNSKPDPLNPNRFLTGQTYIELRDAPPQRWLVPLSADKAGKVQNHQIGGRNVWVYTPNGFQPSGEAYPLVVTLGGSAYMNFIAVTTILDNLIADKRIPPVVAAMVGGTNDDLSCSPEYANYLVKEVVPLMQADFNATKDPARTVIGGASLGGLASTFAALQHPNVFGKVLSQSGSYWWTTPGSAEGEWLTRQVAAMPRQPIQFFMEVGRMEGADVQLHTNRRMRDTLLAKAYNVQYREFNGNHNYINWRDGFGEALIRFLGN